MSDYIIIANGSFLVREIILEAIQNKIIIALDGAADKLARIGIKPDVILGDFDSATESRKNFWGIREHFDSIDETSCEYIANFGVKIVPAKNQDLTDLMKAINYCDKHHATSITIICATGGRLDHDEGTRRTLRTHYNKQRPITLHTEQQTIRFVHDEKIVMSGLPGDKCGIIAYPHGSFSSSGLLYDAQNYPLEFGHSESICNSLTTNEAVITVNGEALAIMPPQLQSQRSYMMKSEIERLQLQLRDAQQVVTEFTIAELHNFRAYRKSHAPKKKDHAQPKLTYYITESKESSYSGDKKRTILISSSQQKANLFDSFKSQSTQTDALPNTATSCNITSAKI